MHSNFSFNFKNAKSFLEMNKSNTLPADSLKSQSTIRKLSFNESMEFEKSTDDSEDFQIDYDSFVKNTKKMHEDKAPLSCFKRLQFDWNEDRDELFAMASLQNKIPSCPSFSQDSYECEEFPIILPSQGENTMEEETSNTSQELVIDIVLKDNAYNMPTRRRLDSFQIESEEQQEQTPTNIASDAMVPDVPCLPTCTNLRDPDLWTISSQTLIDLISEGKRRYLIIDCRYDYEYKGGHVQGAINIDSRENLERLFLTNKEHLGNEQYLEKIKENLPEFFVNSHLIESSSNANANSEPPILIFHCEFSQKRGPRALRALRALDRQLNVHRWPYLYYPQMYILEEGYQNFQGLFPAYCNPQNSYVRMLDKNYREEYACAKENERKTWKKSCAIKPTANLKSWTQRSRTITYY